MTRPDDAMLREAATIATRVAGRYLMTDRRGEAVTPDDVAQDVMIVFLRQDIDSLENWRAWVNRAARNRSIDVVRAGWDARGLPDDGTSAPPVGMRDVGPSAVGIWDSVERTLLATLSDRDRQLLLAHVDGASHAELARDFGLADAASVATTLTRIRRKVRDAFPDRAGVLELLGPPPRVYDVDNRGRRE
ncbi:RNA polymerase sigma factor [Cellulomonas sp. Leaf395]|uniref:RNA polymerase sigma factor n=1 Tax=Cellulomonas sp. Leaf395 TaxID=1736362 RepID=UPI0006F53E67|nr:sigma factor-like helix-turn-helix DNA-binding protein [Cellulomonas sp. Leaf395]KQT01272.1 hypothetical protein ASG23_06775 [Cellulomonas sp. Leaf395]